jgi:hypothetical protein
MARHTVAEAADMLGITTGAVRNRLSRGTLSSTKEDGTVYVLLPADMSRDAERDASDMPTGMSPPERDALISEMVEEMRAEVHYLRGQLHQELGRRSAEAERYQQIVAALTTANASLSERLRELEAPQGTPTEPPEDAETVEEAPDRAEPRPDASGSQEGARRPWWKRIIGG